jgi:hypothetical protein
MIPIHSRSKNLKLTRRNGAATHEDRTIKSNIRSVRRECFKSSACMDAHVTVDDDQGHRHIRLNTVSTRPTVLTDSAFAFSKQAAVNAQRHQADGGVALDPTAQFPETAVLPGLIHKVPVANDRSFSEALCQQCLGAGVYFCMQSFQILI